MRHTKILLAFALLGLAAASTVLAADTPSVITPTSRIDLFNGRDFTGWKLFLPKAGDDVTKTWSVENGVIHNTGKPVGYMRTEQDYRDYKLTVEWRFLKIAPKADNTGVLVHMATGDKLWPACYQCQGKNQAQGDLICMAGAEYKEHQGMGPNTPVAKRGPSVEKPIGEWNLIEMLCSGDDIKIYVNGKLMNEGTACTLTSGKIGIQSEGGDIEIRKLYIEPLPK